MLKTGLSDCHLMTKKKALENSNPELSIIGPTKTSQMKSVGSIY